MLNTKIRDLPRDGGTVANKEKIGHGIVWYNTDGGCEVCTCGKRG